MKKMLVVLGLFLLAVVAVCFAEEVIEEIIAIDYPVFIVRLENSERAVVPWDVEDVHGFTSVVKNPVPRSYLLIGNTARWSMSWQMIDKLNAELFEVGSLPATDLIGWGAWVETVNNVNLDNIGRLMEIVKLDSEFVNIAPVDVSDKIEQSIWNNKNLIYKSDDNEKFGIDIQFRVRDIRDLSTDEGEQILEILEDMDCVFENCNEDAKHPVNPSRLAIRYASIEQVVKLAMNPFVVFISSYKPVMTDIDAAGNY